jgi:N,N'-diacetyl-8-epilegionaminate cytidylyltransferase
MKPHVIGAIFARGGSKGVPRKNLRLLAGKPLIAYSIEAALRCQSINRVIVSTDDEEIAAAAHRFGAEVPFTRPADLATDNAPEWLAWQHAIRSLEEQPNATKIDVLVSVPTTSPLRKAEDIETCIAALLEGEADIVVTVRDAERNPYFNMVTLDEAGFAHLMISPPLPLYTRQSAPKAYDMTTVAYAAKASFVMKSNGLFQGKVKAIVIPQERALDIDTEYDFRLAEFMLTVDSQSKIFDQSQRRSISGQIDHS